VEGVKIVKELDHEIRLYMRIGKLEGTLLGVIWTIDSAPREARAHFANLISKLQAVLEEGEESVPDSDASQGT
jgi:hypothetical protein